MPVTRIKNNQITDSSSGNVYLGVNAAAKVQDYSVTAGKLANNLTYGSNLTITGNLTVQGETTTIDTTNLAVEDPLILLAKEQTGSPTLDIGFIGKRGTSDNITFVWDESADEFVTAFTTSETTNTVVTITAYASLKTLDLAVTGNLAVTGTSTFTGNITSMTVTGDVTAGNLLTPGIASATGNITGANFNTAGLVSATGNVIGGNLTTAGLVSATGNVTGGNITTAGQVSATGNVTGGNIITAGDVNSATLHTSGNAVIGGNLIVQGNITYINIDDLRVEDPIIVLGTGPNGAPLTTDDDKDRGIYMEYYTTGLGNAFMGWQNSTGNMIIANDVTFSGNDVVSVTAYGTLQAGNLYIQSAVSTGNVTGGNLLTGGLISATGNIDGGNLRTAGLVTATGNVTGGNITTGGVVQATGNLIGPNLLLTSGFIDGSGATRITINGSDADVDFAVDGDSTPNVFYVDAGTGTVSFGTSAQTTNAIAAFNTSNSILVPVGNTLQRPGTGVTGMVRFNTTTDALEFYDSDSWTSAGTTFTVIVADPFTGDGSTLAYTLSEDSTTAGTIVSINGVVQIPTTAYSVSGNVLTFTEAPAVSDVIDARILTTSQTVTGIQNSSGNAIFEGSPTSADFVITGNLIPSANVTYNLGSNTARFNDAFFNGTTITLGNVQIKNETGTQIGFFGPDGTTPATIDSVNIDTTTIANGTSNVTVASSGGNVTVGVSGTTRGTFYSSGLSITGGIAANGYIDLNNGTSNVHLPSANGNVHFTVAGNSIIRVTAAGIVNDMGNGVGNIGNSTARFNTIFATATSAQYADLAEMYEADQIIEPGTVVCFGGVKEVTMCAQDACRKIAGVISTNPSYIMNAGLAGDHVVAVALTGRVPTRVTGTIRKGDMLVSTADGRARAEADPVTGSIIGKALADFDGADGIIEVVVGRL
jgi:hypothetical protein